MKEEQKGDESPEVPVKADADQPPVFEGEEDWLGEEDHEHLRPGGGRERSPPSSPETPPRTGSQGVSHRGGDPGCAQSSV